MALGKEQKDRQPRNCACGCQEIFYPFPMYPRDEYGNMRYPLYKRGHHPNPQNTEFGKVPAWNKGLKKGDHPSLENMGFQKGHPTYYKAPRIKEFREDPRNSRKYKTFCAKIHKRDWYTCQICKDRNFKGRGGSIKLEVDHIIPLCINPNGLYDESNVRTLCHDCHVKTDTYGGKTKKLKKKHLELSGKEILPH